MIKFLNSGLLDRAITLNKKKAEYQKIIFLDVDGVMHDYSGNEIVQEERVQRLKKIVDATGASLVLSSSWRYGYPQFLEENGLTELADADESESLQYFESVLKKYGLEIISFTPSSTLGENGRPAEIRSFLLDKPNLKSFVILDDDDFNWQWLNAFLVQTRTIREGRTVLGLEDEHVAKAIAILNQFDENE